MRSLVIVSALFLIGCGGQGQHVSVPVVNREAPSMDPNGNSIELHTSMAQDSLFTSLQRLLVQEGYGVEFSDRSSHVIVSGRTRVDRSNLPETYARTRIVVEGGLATASVDYMDFISRELVGEEWGKAEYGENTDVFTFVLRDLRRIAHDSVRVVRR